MVVYLDGFETVPSPATTDRLVYGFNQDLLRRGWRLRLKFSSTSFSVPSLLDSLYFSTFHVVTSEWPFTTGMRHSSCLATVKDVAF